MDNREKLEDVIGSQIDNLGALKPGSPEHTAATESLAKLYKLRIEETKNERDFMRACESDIDSEREHKLKRDQFEEQVKARRFGTVERVGLAVCGWIVYDIWRRSFLKFEETGAIKSPLTRNLASHMSKLLPHW